MMYSIKKDGKWVKDFSDGAELTSNKKFRELYRDKKSAVQMAREYGRKYGSGFVVVQVVDA